MNLAIFDLDETLIAGDSATLWLNFLAGRGLVSDALLAEDRRTFPEARFRRLQFSAGGLTLRMRQPFEWTPNGRGYFRDGRGSMG